MLDAAYTLWPDHGAFLSMDSKRELRAAYPDLEVRLRAMKEALAQLPTSETLAQEYRPFIVEAMQDAIKIKLRKLHERYPLLTVNINHDLLN